MLRTWKAQHEENFEEELGWKPSEVAAPIGHVKLRSGKIVHGFAVQSHQSEAALLAMFRPGTFRLEWPPKSGFLIDCPEVDRIAFFTIDEARSKLAAAQLPFLDRLRAIAS